MSRSPEPTVDLTLACAVLARQRMHLVVQKATELGVRRIVPLLTDHSVQPDAVEHEQAHAWAGHVARAAKQCRRSSLPHLLAPADARRVPRLAAARGDRPAPVPRRPQRPRRPPPAEPPRRIVLLRRPRGRLLRRRASAARRPRPALGAGRPRAPRRDRRPRRPHRGAHDVGRFRATDTRPCLCRDRAREGRRLPATVRHVQSAVRLRRKRPGASQGCRLLSLARRSIEDRSLHRVVLSL